MSDAEVSGAKERDYWFTVLLTDPVAVPLVRLLARRRWLTPDQVTSLALVLGLSSGAAFMLGTRTSFIAGGVLFYLAFLVDCVDGKLARALGTTSARGEALDHLADAGRRASALLGIAWAVWAGQPITYAGGGLAELRTESLHVPTLWVIVVYAVLAYFFLEISGAAKREGGHGAAGRWSAALARRRLLPNPGMPDVQAIVFVFGPITGSVGAAFVAGIALVGAAILLTVWRRLR